MRTPVTYHHKSYLISLESLNKVWQALSANPIAPHREIAEQVGKSPSLVWASLQLLKRMGHIRFERQGDRARLLCKPKYEVKASYFDD